MLQLLRDPIWQGIGAIIGVLSIFVSIWLARTSKSKVRYKKDTWRKIIGAFSLLLPIYSIFVGSIIGINAFSTKPEVVLYFSVGVASILGVGWGIVWATYLQKVFFTSRSQRQSTKVKSI